MRALEELFVEGRGAATGVFSGEELQYLGFGGQGGEADAQRLAEIRLPLRS